jgi:hypothetical protein
MLLFWIILGCVVALLVVLEIRSWSKPEKLRPGTSNHLGGEPGGAGPGGIGAA